MSDQHDQNLLGGLIARKLRQNLLDCLSAEQQAIEKLSDEELGMVASGGFDILPVSAELPSLDRLSNARSALAKHYKKYDKLYQKTAATTVVGAVGGALTAEGVHK
jgi:hypothetical protein